MRRIETETYASNDRPSNRIPALAISSRPVQIATVAFDGHPTPVDVVGEFPLRGFLPYRAVPKLPFHQLNVIAYTPLRLARAVVADPHLRWERVYPLAQ